MNITGHNSESILRGLKMEDNIDGYIDKITLGGKTYKLRCEVTEVHPMVCPRCGGSITLKYGNGKCDFCGTSYSTRFQIVEN